MNNKEAAEILRQIPQRFFYGRRVNGKQITIEALEHAIRALETIDRIKFNVYALNELLKEVDNNELKN